MYKLQKTGTSGMVIINMILARIFMKKWMIHDVHIKPADENSVDDENWISIDKIHVMNSV